MPPREPTGLRELTSLLGEGSSFDGKLLFEGRVRIDGKFRGEIASDDILVVGEHADVDAKIEVGTLIVLGGTLRGEVRAQKTVELHSPAKVFGNITAPQLMIDRGVQFEGQSRTAEAAVATHGGGAPSSERAEHEATSAPPSPADVADMGASGGAEPTSDK